MSSSKVASVSDSSIIFGGCNRRTPSTAGRGFDVAPRPQEDTSARRRNITEEITEGSNEMKEEEGLTQHHRRYHRMVRTPTKGLTQHPQCSRTRGLNWSEPRYSE